MCKHEPTIVAELELVRARRDERESDSLVGNGDVDDSRSMWCEGGSDGSEQEED